MQYGANLLHKTNLHGLQHQSSTSANEKKKTIFDSWKLSTLALIVNISIESVLFLFQKPNICEFVFIELTPLDHARKILMQKILFIYALIFWSRKDNENFGNLYHHFIHGIKKITPSLRNHDIWTENAPIIFFSKICYDLTIVRKFKSLQFRKSWLWKFAYADVLYLSMNRPSLGYLIS